MVKSKNRKIYTMQTLIERVFLLRWDTLEFKMKNIIRDKEDINLNKKLVYQKDKIILNKPHLPIIKDPWHMKTGK